MDAKTSVARALALAAGEVVRSCGYAFCDDLTGRLPPSAVNDLKQKYAFQLPNLSVAFLSIKAKIGF